MDNEQKLKFLQENFEDKGDKCDIAIRLDVAKQLCNVILGQEAGVVQMGCRHLPVNVLVINIRNKRRSQRGIVNIDMAIYLGGMMSTHAESDSH